MRVHSFVAMIFLGDRSDQGLHVLHYDGNPLNNSLENLRWGTHKDNFADRDRHGTTARGERHGRSKLTKEQVLQIPVLRAEGLSQRKIAALFGVHNTLISYILRGKSWSHLFSNPERGENIAA